MREYLSSAADVLREQGSDGQAGLASGVAAVLCGMGGLVFAFYNERKVLGVLES